MTFASLRKPSLIAALALVLALGTLLLWQRFAASRRAQDLVKHTYQVMGIARELQIAVLNAETGQRGYLLTGRDDYLAPYHQALDAVTLLQGDLRRLTADNSGQQDRLRRLASAIQRKLEELGQTIQLRRDAGPEAAMRIVGTDRGRLLMVEIEQALHQAVVEEEALLATRLARQGEAENRAWLLALGGLAVACLLLGLATRLVFAAQGELRGAEAAQRALARQLRATLDAVSQGIAVFTPESRLARWNTCFPQLLALPEGELHEQLDYAAVTEAAARAAFGQALLETAEQVRHGPTGSGPVVYDRQRATDGRNLEMRRTPMPDGGFVLTLSDITERSRAEAASREAQRMQAMGQLTGGIAHDFNNLLAVVIGNLELIKPKLGADHAMLPRVERALWGARRGAGLTQQLLAFARRQPLAPSPINLSAMLADMVTLLRRTLGEPIDIRVVDAAGLWPAMADAVQVESALLNLALNARDAMPEGGRLTIELANKVLDADYARRHAEVRAGDYVMLAVSDTGTGMPPEVLARVFEPFFTTKPVGKGTGLGLAMVYGFAKQSGGHVKIYSEPGEGTTVRLYLPRAIGVALPPQGVPVELPHGDSTVLVVEDDPNVREVTVAILRDLGYAVLQAADGAEALAAFDAADPPIDLLLLDIVLPGGMKGDEVARRIAARRPGIRTLFMSGYTENAIVHHGRLDDGVRLLGKPFSREQLARKVAEALAAETAR